MSGNSRKLEELIKNSFNESSGTIVSHLFKAAKTSSQDISRLIARPGEQFLQTKP